MLIAYPLFIFGYDDKTTHPLLTEQIVKFYNLHYPDKAVASDDTEAIIQGSIDEDKGTRWMQHYYDPVHNTGLTYLGTKWESSRAWSQDTLAQASSGQTGYAMSYLGFLSSMLGYYQSPTDYSWDRAVYEYAWGDKKRGLESLGHVLHLMEDASVPDHTRNDPHPGLENKVSQTLGSLAPQQVINYLGSHNSFNGSPYEGFARFRRGEVDIVKDLKGLKPVELSTVDGYFYDMAMYSNNNFFSRDTILTGEYLNPKILREELVDGKDGSYKIGYGRDSFGQKIRLAKIDIRFGDEELEYSLNDDDNLILTDYWNHLSKQAVLHGAGVLRLFFDEVEKEKRTKQLYAKNRSWIAKEIDRFKSRAFSIASALYGITVRETDLYADDSVPEQNGTQLEFPESSSQPNVSLSAVPFVASTPSPSPLPSVRTSPSPTPRQTSAPQSSFSPTTPPSPTTTPKPFASATPRPQNTWVSSGGSGGGSAANSPQQTPVPQSSASSPSPSPSIPTSSNISTPDIDPPEPPVITYPSDDGVVFASADIIFKGTAEPQSTISSSVAQTTALTAGDGTWQLLISGLLHGTTTVSFIASDAAGNNSDPAERTVTVDSEGPFVLLTIDECAHSLGSDSCMLTHGPLHLGWSTADTDIDHYAIECTQDGSPCPNFDFAETSATGTTYSLPSNNRTFVFKATAFDTAGNAGDEITKRVTIAAHPVVINEIAWSGTNAQASDEWIELYNPTARLLSLSGLTLRSLDSASLNIPLSGSIAPRGFYLIERTSDTTVSDVPAQLVAPFGHGLNDGGMQLGIVITDSGEVLDKTPDPNPCRGWCAGNKSTRTSMERYDPAASGESRNNWDTANSMIQNGRAANGSSISGTPGRRNSINYLIANNVAYIAVSKTLSKTSSPYVVPSLFEIQSGATLTIEPGTVIKFYGTSAGLAASGNIIAQGTADDPIVFTSFKDDAYGGDVNGDATSTAPSAGDWGTLSLLGNGSVFDHAIIRYGGNRDTGFSNWADVRAKQVSLAITNSLIEESAAYGLWLETVNGTFDHNTVRRNRAVPTTYSTGMYASDSSLTITRNVFTDNTYGLTLTGSGMSDVSDNTFTNNTYQAIQLINARAAVSGNTAVGNGQNGINVQAPSEDNEFYADLPYILNTMYGVPPGKTLTIDAGSVVKFSSNGGIYVEGRLLAQGTADNPVVFTSVKDDDCGLPAGCGDTDNASSTPKAGDWLNISFGNGSGPSVVDHAIIRYGGSIFVLDPQKGAVRLLGGAVAITNTIIEDNYFAGVWMEHAQSTVISDSVIRNHQGPPAFSPGYGIYLSASSSPKITNTRFSNNREHIRTDPDSTYTDGGGNVFEP